MRVGKEKRKHKDKKNGTIMTEIVHKGT